MVTERVILSDPERFRDCIEERRAPVLRGSAGRNCFDLNVLRVVRKEFVVLIVLLPGRNLLLELDTVNFYNPAFDGKADGNKYHNIMWNQLF
ncbi:MAG: hypothetical protein J0L62_00015 [Bacteroidetes bacterium]|nr:hypothetical protein [Bacteroidota bacterium]